MSAGDPGGLRIVPSNITCRPVEGPSLALISQPCGLNSVIGGIFDIYDTIACVTESASIKIQRHSSIPCVTEWASCLVGNSGLAKIGTSHIQ